MNHPKFSIIVPTFNRGYMILPTLESLFNQTFKDFEIIVVDDCSTDNTEEVLQPYIDDNKLNYIKHERNKERAHARNTGLKKAQGQYITFLDSDDFMYSTCLEEANNYIKSNNSVRIFHCLYELVDENQNRIRKFNFPPIKKARNSILKGNYLACMGVFLHRDIYQKYRFDTAPLLTGSEDHEYWIRILADYPKLGRINKVLCGLQEHPNRTMNQHKLKNSIERKTYMLEKFNSHVELRSKYPRQGAIFQSYCMTFIASASLDAGSKSNAWKYLLKALIKDTRIIFDVFFRKVLILSLIRTKS